MAFEPEVWVLEGSNNLWLRLEPEGIDGHALWMRVNPFEGVKRFRFRWWATRLVAFGGIRVV